MFSSLVLPKNKSLRINRQHGTYIVDYAEEIGLGSKNYKAINLK